MQAGFQQVSRIPGVVPQNMNIKSCNNPTFSSDGTNTLAKTAPYPPACDKKGATQCTTGTGGASRTSTKVNGSSGSRSDSGGSGTGAVATAGAGAGAATSGSTVAVDPNTGQVVAAGQLGTSGDSSVTADAVQLASAADSRLQRALMGLAVVLFAGVVFGPPLLARRLSRNRQNGGAS